MTDLFENDTGVDEAVNILHPGNSKLGRREGIWHTALLPVKTCPGRSEECTSICYAWMLGVLRESVGDNWTKATRLAMERPDVYFSRMKGEISRKRTLDALRLHEAGDFFSVEYIEGWIDVAETFPELPIWAYTRSWRDPEMLEALERLKGLPNVQIFASIDDEIREEAKEVVPHWRWADIVPKDAPPGFQDGAIVCPNQVAKDRGKEVTCASCKFCFQDRGEGVRFRVH